MSTIDNSRTFNSNEVNNKYSYYCKLIEEKLKNHQGFFILFLNHILLIL